jgi:lycopene cyclase-like protein
MRYDLVIAGAGPAGLVLAALAGEAGLRVALLAGVRGEWTPSYGAWVDRFAGLGFQGSFSQVWPEAEVWLGEDNPVVLRRAYARVDNVATRASLLERCAAAGVELRDVEAVSVAHDASGSVVQSADGAAWSCALCVDATGHRARLVQRVGEPTLWQAAYGVRGRITGSGLSPERVRFMDFRAAPGATGELPTFLYGMASADGEVFLEETSLVRGPAVEFALLRARLEARMSAAGMRVERVDDVERCLIPMDAPLPDLRQRVVGFGGAAAMVHPASGYLWPAVLRAAPRLVAAVADELGRASSPAKRARAAWRAVWPTAELRRRELFLYGTRIVAGLNTADTLSFFRAFFSTPETLWRGYLDDASLALVMRSMASSFVQCDDSMRWKLVRSGAQLPGALWRPVLA